MSIEKIVNRSEYQIADIGDIYQIADIGDMHAYCHVGGKDSVVGSKVVPNANFSWQCGTGLEQFFLNINRAAVSVLDEKETFQNDELKLKIGDNTDIWKIVDGKLKWDIEFEVKPQTNIFEWDIAFSSGLRFGYQDTIENDHKNFGYKEYPELKDYQAKYRRPDNVVGSYAIFCNRRNRMIGEYDYGTGKLGHIYRPLVIDADNNEVWAELYIDPVAKILRITIPQSFLDTAIYPVRLDPTFGYDTIGASTTDIDKYLYALNPDNPGSDGTATSIDIYCKNYSGNDVTICVGIYDDSAGIAGNLKETEDCDTLLSSETTLGWRVFSLSPTIAVLSANTYHLGVSADVNNRCETRYDGASPNQRDSDTYVTPWNDPWSYDNKANFAYSVRCTYTVAGTTVSCTLGTVVIAGLNATVTNDTDISATLGAVSISGLNASVQLDTLISASLGQLAISGLNASSVISYTLIPASLGTLAVVGLNATVTNDTDISCSLGQITIAGLNATVQAGQEVQCTLGQVTVAGYQATINAEIQISCTLGQVTIAGFSASITIGTKISSSLGTVAIAGLNVSIATGILIKPTTGILVIAGYLADVFIGFPEVETPAARVLIVKNESRTSIIENENRTLTIKQ
jgi:hypothetical protein